MNWQVTYRENSGAKKSVFREASSRAELFKNLSKDGIKPISVTQVAASKSLPKLHMRSVLLVSGAVAIIGVGVALFNFLSDSHKPIPKKIKAPKVVQIKTVRPDLPSPLPEPAKVPATSVETRKAISPFTGELVTITQRVVKLDENASRLNTVFTNNISKPPKKLFGTLSENYVCGLMRTEPGMPIVGIKLPKHFDEEFKARIADPVEILPDDTQEDIELKNQMFELKREMAKLIGEGKTPSEIIIEERKGLQRLAQMRLTLLGEMARLKNAGATQAEIDDYVAAANQILDREGAKQITYKINPFLHIQKDQTND